MASSGGFYSGSGKAVGYVRTGGTVSGLDFVQEGTGSDPFATTATTSWKKIYRDRLAAEFVPVNDRKWSNFRIVVDKKLGSDPDSSWDKYVSRCAFYGLEPQPWIIDVEGTLNGGMDGTYVEMGVENGHIKFQRLKDDDGYPDEISWHKGEWTILQLIPHIANTTNDGQFHPPKRIVRELCKSDLSSGLPPEGTGPAKEPWTHTTSIRISGGPPNDGRGPSIPEGAILVSHATYDPCNGVYYANEDGTYQNNRGWALFDDGSGKWKFEKDGVYYYESTQGVGGPFTIEKDSNYSGRAAIGKTEWQKFILAHNDHAKCSFPVVSGL